MEVFLMLNGMELARSPYPAISRPAPLAFEIGGSVASHS
jgi:hypothetical protein